jgi:hypothetical protein
MNINVMYSGRRNIPADSHIMPDGINVQKSVYIIYCDVAFGHSSDLLSCVGLPETGEHLTFKHHDKKMHDGNVLLTLVLSN